MASKAIRAILAALLLPLVGCGTIENFTQIPRFIPAEEMAQIPRFVTPEEMAQKPTIYGGVQASLGFEMDNLQSKERFESLGSMLRHSFVDVYLLAIDTPLSFVADTLTLPWTITATMKRQSGQDKQEIKEHNPSNPSRQERITAWPRDWSSHVGQTVTLEGTAVDLKFGARLHGDGNAIWIDGLDAWPDGFYLGGEKGKRLRVTGVVIKRDDLPVFFQKPGEPVRQGMPVKSEEELATAKWRYLLKNAKWTVLD